MKRSTHFILSICIIIGLLCILFGTLTAQSVSNPIPAKQKEDSIITTPMVNAVQKKPQTSKEVRNSLTAKSLDTFIELYPLYINTMKNLIIPENQDAETVQAAAKGLSTQLETLFSEYGLESGEFVELSSDVMAACFAHKQRTNPLSQKMSQASNEELKQLTDAMRILMPTFNKKEMDLIDRYYDRLMSVVEPQRAEPNQQ